MSIEAIAEELEKIGIKNEAGNSSENNWASFADKTLMLNHMPTSNVNRVRELNQYKCYQKIGFKTALVN